MTLNAPERLLIFISLLLPACSPFVHTSTSQPLTLPSARAEAGYLNLTHPGEAVVFIDGVPRGVTPLLAPVKPGVRVVVFNVNGRNSAPQFVDVAPNTEVIVSAAVATRPALEGLPFDPMGPDEYLSAAEGDPGADQMVEQLMALDARFQTCAVIDPKHPPQAAVIELRVIVRGHRAIAEPLLAVATHPEVVECVQEVARSARITPVDDATRESWIETVVAVGPRDTLDPMFGWFELAQQARGNFGQCVTREGEVGQAELERHRDDLSAYAIGAPDQLAPDCAKESLGTLMHEPSFLMLTSSPEDTL